MKVNITLDMGLKVISILIPGFQVIFTLTTKFILFRGFFSLDFARQNFWATQKFGPPAL